jgi:hypothetical protein
MPTPLTNEDLGAIMNIVSGQLNSLRDTRNAIEAAGLMTPPLFTAICRECDRLNLLDTRINDAMKAGK